jgi:hypothetical protein
MGSSPRIVSNLLARAEDAILLQLQCSNYPEGDLGGAYAGPNVRPFVWEACATFAIRAVFWRATKSHVSLFATGSVVMALLMTGCGQSGGSSLPAGKGAVVGGIEGCYALSAPDPIPFLAGTVSVFKGISASGAKYASLVVSANQRFRFVLRAGEYTLSANSNASGFRPPVVTVSVGSGETVNQNLVFGGCI